MLMIPGLGYFYSGLARRQNALSLIFLCMASLAMVSIQWFLFGFSLSFGNGSPFIGTFDHDLFLNLFESQEQTMGGTATIPISVFMVYQGISRLSSYLMGYRNVCRYYARFGVWISR